MPRPRKWRKVCRLPEVNSFGPLGQKTVSGSVAMTVDEYEAIRLIDFEGLNQEACAEKMHVARTTVQSVYASARKKIAEVLVSGAILRIEGGEYKLCDGNGALCGSGGCRRESEQCRSGVRAGVRGGKHAGRSSGGGKGERESG